jgi:predicted RNA-binding protein associated with RNAse of E/G family
VWAARPARLVRDDEDLVVAYLAAGMRWKRPVAAAGDFLRVPADGWALADAVWTTSRMLYLMPPGAAHSIHLWWKAPDWAFGGWYVNLQEPIRRTRLGFDYMDQTLDIVIEPDLSWHWKDEDEIGDAIRSGFLTPEWARAIRAEGERAIERLERRAAPFSDGWERWRPDPAWPDPELPEGWDTLDLD